MRSAAPPQHPAGHQQQAANHVRAGQQRQGEGVDPQPDQRGRNQGDQHTAERVPLAPRKEAVRHPVRTPQAGPQRGHVLAKRQQQRRRGAEMHRHVVRKVEPLRAAVQGLRQHEVAGRRNGEKLGQPLQDGQQHRVAVAHTLCPPRMPDRTARPGQSADTVAAPRPSRGRAERSAIGIVRSGSRRAISSR